MIILRKIIIKYQQKVNINNFAIKLNPNATEKRSVSDLIDMSNELYIMLQAKPFLLAAPERSSHSSGFCAKFFRCDNNSAATNCQSVK